MVTLAMRRLPPDVKTPAELVTFRVEEWAATDGERPGAVRFGVGRLRGMRGWRHIRTRSSGTCLTCSGLRCR
jgi:hypothetical protein